MSKDAYKKFDFRKAGTSDYVVRTLKTWLHKSEGTFSDSWEAVAGTHAELKCETVLSRTFEEGIRSVGSSCIGYAIFLADDKLPSLACISNEDVIALVSHIVGTNAEEKVKGRKLTSIEISLCRLLFETLGSALSIAFAGSEPLKIELGECDETPQLSRLIPVEELVLCTNIQLVIPDATLNATWLLPRKATEKLFESATGYSFARTANSPTDVVLQIPLDLVGLLGHTEMEMSSVAKLKSGDLLVLDQKIDEPISVNIDDKEIFQCWPGRIGNQQGLEIISIS